MLRDEIARYTELSGNDGLHTPIGIIGAYLDGYEKGKADAQPRWIPCERELPELGIYVLVSHVGSVFVDCLTMENGDLLFWETGVFLAEEIRNLAWMPLPTPWKGEDDVRHKEKGD